MKTNVTGWMWDLYPQDEVDDAVRYEVEVSDSGVRIKFFNFETKQLVHEAFFQLERGIVRRYERDRATEQDTILWHTRRSPLGESPS